MVDKFSLAVQASFGYYCRLFFRVGQRIKIIHAVAVLNLVIFCILGCDRLAVCLCCFLLFLFLNIVFWT